MLQTIATALLNILTKLAQPFAFIWLGRKSVEAQQDKKDAKILKEQRDNDTDDLSSARERMRLRRKKQRERNS